MALGLEKNKEKTIKDIQEYLATDKKNHPFDDDLLNLRGIAETLSEIISKTKDPFVYSLNSPYGTGKTFFLRRFHCLLEQKNCLVVSYNAWESDFYSDPISALMGELSDQIDYKKFKNLKKPAVSLKNISIRLSVGLVSVGAVAEDTQKEYITYQKHKKRKEKFIEALKKFTENLPFPLVFIIDELDRCRPDYAIQTLEIIKHFFNIPKITFVIGVDRKQIESTVRVLYGSNIDTCCDEYLRKFIDQDFYLPKLSSTTYIKNLCNKHLTSVLPPFCGEKKFFSMYKQTLFAPIFTHKHNLDFIRHSMPTGKYDTDCATIKEQFTNTTINLITAYVDALSEYFVFSLRKQEQFVISLKILFSLLSEDKDVLLPELACLLTAIKLYDNSMLNKPKSALFNIFSFENAGDLANPDIIKLINKSEGVLNNYKITEIKKETIDTTLKLNSIQKWQIHLNDYANRQDLQFYNTIGKYLQLTKQLSLLEKS
jgi:hypothetical protein